MKNRMVIYYSFEGNTKEAAEKIAESLDADILEVKMNKDIPNRGMKKFLIGGMQSIFGVCPHIQYVDTNFNKYDEIILGTPVWADRCASPINSVLKIKGIKDKVTAVFTCSGGGENYKCIKRLQKKLPYLKYSASLADRNNSISKENHKHMESFVDKIMCRG